MGREVVHLQIRNPARKLRRQVDLLGQVPAQRDPSERARSSPTP
jgi:hypothetical protein